MSFENMWGTEKKPTISLELFPPKNQKTKEKLFGKLEKFSELNPDFISVTFGAGGSTRTGSLELIKKLKKVYSKKILSYFACYGLGLEEIKNTLNHYRDEKVNSVLCVRGDKPEDLEGFTAAKDGFHHADELVSFTKEAYDFSIGVAGYPEGHKECVSLDEDLKHLKDKVDRGAGYIISQYFFENTFFYKFRDKCRKAGIKVPILAGVMPIYNLKVLENLSRLCGTAITYRVKHGLKQIDSNNKKMVNEFGIGFAAEQCKDLIKNDVDGIHFYTLNRTKSIIGIFKTLKNDNLI